MNLDSYQSIVKGFVFKCLFFPPSNLNSSLSCEVTFKSQTNKLFFRSKFGCRFFFSFSMRPSIPFLRALHKHVFMCQKKATSLMQHLVNVRILLL